MDNVICYRNTDLDLQSQSDLRPLFRAFVARDMTGYDPLRNEDGSWWASVSMANLDEPEKNIADMLSVVESLPPDARGIWDSCFLREFNIGYDCGEEPRWFYQALSATLVARIAAVGASLGITLYPNTDESCEVPG